MNRFLDLLSFISVLLVSLFAGLAVRSDSANATGGDIRVITGLATGEASITPHSGSCGTDFWHCDEASHPSNTSLDLTNAVGATGNATVNFNSYTYGGYAYAVTSNHVAGGSLCPGVDVNLWVPYPDSSVGTWIGSVDFVQITPGITFGAGFYLASAGWTITYMGTVKDGNPGGGCLWDGVHVHQSATPRSTIPYVWTNWGVESDDDGAKAGRQIWSAGDFATNWLHQIQY